MSLRGRSRIAFPVLSPVAIAVLLVALYGHRQVLNERRRAWEGARPQLLRLEVEDRLRGLQLPDIELVDSAGAPVSLRGGQDRRAIWLVDAESCAGCLEASLAEWQYMQRTYEIEGLLVLSGVTPAQAPRWVRGAGLRSPLALDPDGKLSEELSIDVPFAVLVTDDRGLIVDAAVRAYGPGDARCGLGTFRRMGIIHGR